MRRIAIWTIAALAVVYGGYSAYSDYAAWLYHMAGQYDRMMNPYGVDPDAPEPTEDDVALHRSMFIADMHADTLKWERDLLERSTFGHTDVPRMLEGNVALQGFTIVTKSPMRMPWSKCVSGDSPDTNTVLSLLQGRPAFDLKARAFYQIDRFKDAVARSKEGPGPELRLIRDIDDLTRLVEDRKAGKPVIGGVLGIEGGHWVGGESGGDDAVKADMEELFHAGVRMFAPNHRFDNALSGSSEGCDGYGLTPRGETALTKAERLGMLVDVAHISPAGLRDAAMLLHKPFTNSHTGIRAECEEPCRVHRNLSDSDIEVILRQGGVISVGFWPQAIGPSVWRVADVMEHIMDIAEDLDLRPSRHIALGSDYDGSVTPLIEVSNLEALTAIMRQRDRPFDEETVRDIAGRNACRIFASQLPGGDPVSARYLCDELSDLPESEIPVASSDVPTGDDAPEDEAGAAPTGGPGDPPSLDGGDPRVIAAGASDNLITHLVGWVVRMQSEMNHWLRGHLLAASPDNGGGGAAGLAIVLLGFVYGLVHAAGPGHGKFVVGSYFLSHPGRPARAVALGAAMAFLQAVTAIAIVTGLLIMAGVSMPHMLDKAAAVEAIAYGLILLLGLSMLLRCGVRGTACGHCAGGRHDHRHDQRRDHIAMVLAVGLRPCSGALVLLLFTLTAGIYLVGIAATLAMALGTAITISITGLGAIGARRGAGWMTANVLGAGALRTYGPAAALTAQAACALAIAGVGALFLTASVLRMGVL